MATASKDAAPKNATHPAAEQKSFRPPRHSSRTRLDAA